METSPRHHTDEEAYDTRLDSLVDSGLTYDEARARLGTPPYELVETTPSIDHAPESIRRRVGSAVVSVSPDYHRSRGPFGEEETVGLPGGKPLYFRPPEEAILSDEQVETNDRGLEKVRQALADAKENRED